MLSQCVGVMYTGYLNILSKLTNYGNHAKLIVKLYEPRHEKICFAICRKADWFESYLVGNPEDRFSRDEAHIRGPFQK